MIDEKVDPSFDPYRPLEKNLKFADVLNRLMLLRPRQRIVQVLKGQHVLDVCCGTGNLTAMLAEAGCQAVGVDSSSTMLSIARRKHIAAEFENLDAAELPFEREFDAAVVSIALHEMLPQVRERVWESMRRAVLPRGRLIALDYSLPQRSTLFTRIARGFTERDERAFLDVYPPHYENFQEFMRNGGLLTWIGDRGQAVEAEYSYWGGAVTIVVVKR